MMDCGEIAHEFCNALAQKLFFSTKKVCCAQFWVARWPMRPGQRGVIMRQAHRPQGGHAVREQSGQEPG